MSRFETNTGDEPLGTSKPLKPNYPTPVPTADHVPGPTPQSTGGPSLTDDQHTA